jgi:hypothetical protein
MISRFGQKRKRWTIYESAQTQKCVFYFVDAEFISWENRLAPFKVCRLTETLEQVKLN